MAIFGVDDGLSARLRGGCLGRLRGGSEPTDWCRSRLRRGSKPLVVQNASLRTRCGLLRLGDDLSLLLLRLGDDLSLLLLRLRKYLSLLLLRLGDDLSLLRLRLRKCFSLLRLRLSDNLLVMYAPWRIRPFR